MTLRTYGAWSIHNVANVKLVRDPNHHCIDLVITPKNENGYRCTIGDELTFSLWGPDQEWPTVTVDVSTGQIISIPVERMDDLTAVESVDLSEID